MTACITGTVDGFNYLARQGEIWQPYVFLVVQKLIFLSVTFGCWICGGDDCFTTVKQGLGYFLGEQVDFNLLAGAVDDTADE